LGLKLGRLDFSVRYKVCRIDATQKNKETILYTYINRSFSDKALENSSEVGGLEVIPSHFSLQTHNL